MIPSPPIQLTQVIERVQANNEKKIAAETGIPQQDISTETALLLRHFSDCCKARGVKSLPAAPPTVALFVRHEAGAGVSHDRILDALSGIEALHDNQGLPNPVATAVVRTELGRILNLDGQPRSWPKADRLKFNSLPIEIRAVIERRERQNTRVLRKLQNDFASLRQKKEDESGLRQESTT